jgi:hypothetical protein
MNEQNEIRTLQLFYAGLMVDAAANFEYFGVAQQVREKKARAGRGRPGLWPSWAPPPKELSARHLRRTPAELAELKAGRAPRPAPAVPSPSGAAASRASRTA